MIIKGVSLDRVNRKADKSISLHFTTALEQTSDQLKELDEAIGSCVIAIKENEIEFEFADLERLEIADIDIPEKSPSKRLKDVLWRCQEQELNRKPENKEAIEYYRIKMNQIIEHYKSKLL